MTLGSTIAKLREQRGWSQGQVAVRADMKATQVSRIERDVHETINARTLARLAMAFDVSTDYLMCEAGWMRERPHPKELAASEQRLIDNMHQIKSDVLRRRVLEQMTAMVESILTAQRSRTFSELHRVADPSEDYRESQS
jgi:transcriptional regulator with XRE-family HTH domain